MEDFENSFEDEMYELDAPSPLENQDGGEDQDDHDDEYDGHRCGDFD